MKYSIIITSYNRAWCIERSILSAFAFIERANWNGEIILVDDGSTDQTINVVKKLLTTLDKSYNEKFNLIELPENKGVCTAKNCGVKFSQGKWVIFLDSDDEFIIKSYEEMDKIINNNQCYFAHFFETNDENFTHKETLINTTLLDINKLVMNGTNGRDAVPVIRRDVKNKFPYEEGINGYEGIVYLRIAREYGAIPLHGLAIVQVHTNHNDRLSSSSGQKHRFKDLAQGHKLVLTEHWSIFQWKSRIKMILRLFKSNYLFHKEKVSK